VNDAERDPYKFVVLTGFVVLSAVTLIKFDSQASPILRAFPPPWGQILLLGIVLNGGISLYGITMQRTVRGVLWERAGQIGLAIHFLVYGTWGFIVFREKATGFAGLLITLAIAAILRVVQIEKRRRRAVGRGSA
jgi:hypothetical protein